MLLHGIQSLDYVDKFPAPPPAEKPKEASMPHKEEPKRKLKLF
jgi:hypothetical protein